MIIRFSNTQKYVRSFKSTISLRIRVWEVMHYKSFNEEERIYFDKLSNILLGIFSCTIITQSHSLGCIKTYHQ